MLKILLVEDDEFFRQAVRQVLQEQKWVVTEAPDGRKAKEIATVSPPFDVIISDIQMPHLTGVEFLQWVKENKPMPFILMTGFALIMETKKAHELGADDFLSKPFDTDEMIKIVQRVCAEKLNIKKGELEKELKSEDYCKVSIEEFVAAPQISFDVFVKLGSRYVKIGHKGDNIPADRIQSYKEKGLKHLYIQREDFRNLVSFNLSLAKMVSGSKKVNPEKRANFMRYTGEVVLEKAFVAGMDAETFSEAKDFLNTSMDVLTEDLMAFEMLDSLNSYSDQIYAHSLCVSIYSVLIAKKMRWTSTSNLFKLSLCGLFHDIGKKEIDREIMAKPRPLLTYAEREIIETHPARGHEILLALKQIPSEAAIVAYEHHEDNIGTGYPRKLDKSAIHPYTQIVRVANLFAEFTLKGSQHQSMTPPSAIEYIAKHYGDTISEDAFAALKSLIQAPKGQAA